MDAAYLARGLLAAALGLAPLNSAGAAALGPGEGAWRDAGLGAVRGVTIGPIESTRHPGKGYGTAASARTMADAAALGATWVSLTPFGRAWDLAPSGVDLTFETPFAA